MKYKSVVVTKRGGSEVLQVIGNDLRQPQPEAGPRQNPAENPSIFSKSRGDFRSLDTFALVETSCKDFGSLIPRVIEMIQIQDGVSILGHMQAHGKSCRLRSTAMIRRAERSAHPSTAAPDQHIHPPTHRAMLSAASFLPSAQFAGTASISLAL